ncbi:MAG: DHH family phosphoesterase [Bacteroidaceae bacterium]|nr:DHH family phosphoesterase [Bacteroidaceae bacterium]
MLEQIIPQNSIDAVEKIISCNNKFVILSHKNPDGDALGSSLALYHYIKNRGKNVQVVLPNPYPDFLAWLPGADDVLLYENDREKVCEAVSGADAFFCLDFNTLSRIGDVGEVVAQSDAPKILVDHHPFPTDEFVVKISFPEACSTSELVYRLIEMLSGDVAVSYEMAQCVYTGMMTDTGAFAYASARKDIYLIIAALLDKGIDKDLIYRKVFYTYSMSRMRLMGYVMYRKLKVYKQFNAALLTLEHDELMRFYAVKGDTEGLVNQPLQIKGMRFSCFLREEQPGKINVSLRSVDDFPCNEVAAEFFNGGGHKNASGGELHCSMAEAVELFGKAIKKFRKQLTE